MAKRPGCDGAGRVLLSAAKRTTPKPGSLPQARENITLRMVRFAALNSTLQRAGGRKGSKQVGVDVLEVAGDRKPGAHQAEQAGEQRQHHRIYPAHAD
jgi:hypothetical protein